MASPIDLAWTGALAGTLAGLAAFGQSPKTANSGTRRTGIAG
jgi:hypothetical protein